MIQLAIRKPIVVMYLIYITFGLLGILVLYKYAEVNQKLEELHKLEKRLYDSKIYLTDLEKRLTVFEARVPKKVSASELFKLCQT